MKKRNLPKNSNREKIRREKDPIPWRYCLLTLVCGVILVGGFFVAARSHFSSIDFGIKNSSLKKQIEDMEAEKRLLLLSKEIALSPAELKRAAKKIGLTEMTASSFETVRSSDEKTEKTQTVKNSEEKPKQTVAAAKLSNVKTVEKVSKDGVQKDRTQTAKREIREKSPTQIAKK
jgi:hypothetical protein